MTCVQNVPKNLTVYIYRSYDQKSSILFFETLCTLILSLVFSDCMSSFMGIFFSIGARV